MLTLGAKPGVFCCDQIPLVLSLVFTFDDCTLTKGSGISVFLLHLGARLIGNGTKFGP